jgi:hypothetical protein
MRHRGVICPASQGNGRVSRWMTGELRRPNLHLIDAFNSDHVVALGGPAGDRGHHEPGHEHGRDRELRGRHSARDGADLALAPNRPLWRSTIACRISSPVFMTNGPCIATGSSIGSPLNRLLGREPRRRAPGDE